MERNAPHLSKFTIRLIIMMLVAALGIAVFLFNPLRSEARMVKRIEAPDGKIHLEVWENPRFAHAPGDALSGDGSLILRRKDGQVLRRMELGLVSSVDGVIWLEDRVHVIGVAEWSFAGD